MSDKEESEEAVEITEEEEAKILRFYDIESLEVLRWKESAAAPNKEVKTSQAQLLQLAQYGRTGDSCQLLDKELEYDGADPLGIKPSIYAEAGLDNASSLPGVVISKDDFNPRAFLKSIHGKTNLADLEKGIERLSTGIEKRTEILKELVKANFDRFINAKSVIDGVYEHMKKSQLNDVTEFGTKKFSAALEDASANAFSSFGPILDRRQKAERIRATLAVLERYKFFFKLPQTLDKYIRASRFDIYIRDYKKGKYLLHSITKGDASLGLPVQNSQTEVFKKVWDEVEKVTVRVRQLLLDQLKNPQLSMDLQERNINMLLDLDTSENPLWVYIDNQHKWIIELLQQAFLEYKKKLAVVSFPKRGDAEDLQKRRMYFSYFKRCLLLLGTKEFDSIFESSVITRIWKSTLEFIEEMIKILNTKLPTLWKLASSFLNDKSLSGDKEKYSQCMEKQKEIICVFKGILDEVFAMDGKSSSFEDNGSFLSPFHFPYQAVIAPGYFLPQIMRSLYGVMDHFENNDMAFALTCWTQVVEKAQQKIVTTLCDWWLEAMVLSEYEDWVIDNENDSYNITLLPHIFYRFQRFMIKRLGKMNQRKKSLLWERLVDRIKLSFNNSFEAALDSLQLMANRTSQLSLKEERDSLNQKTKLLLILCNISYLDSVLNPKILELFGTTFRCDMSSEGAYLSKITSNLFQFLFDSYIFSISIEMGYMIRNGINNSPLAINTEAGQSTNFVRSYMLQVLLQMVCIHADVRTFPGNASKRIISSLVERLSEVILESVRSLPVLTSTTALQIKVETCLLQKTFSHYGTPRATDTIDLIHSYLDQFINGTKSDISSSVNSTLSSLAPSIRNQFLCFQPLLQQ